MGICWIIKQLSCSILRNIPWFSQLGLRPRRLSIRCYSARFRRIIVKYFDINKLQQRKQKSLIQHHSASRVLDVLISWPNLNKITTFLINHLALNELEASWNRANASVKSSCAHAPPPGLTPGISIFFSWMANSPGVGTLKLPNAPRLGRRKRANAPSPGSYVPNQHGSSFHSLHNNTPFSIKCVIFCFFRPASPSSTVCNGTIRC